MRLARRNFNEGGDQRGLHKRELRLKSRGSFRLQFDSLLMTMIKAGNRR